MSQPTPPTKIFVSHSHHEREIAGAIKDELNRFGGLAFVAHEDINPTEEWKSALLRNLRECDVFLALLSGNFASSEWTDQESGIAVALGKVIVPVKVNLDPYGFIGKYQALRWDFEEPKLSLGKLVKVLFEKKQLTVEGLIRGFAESYSYDDAGLNAELLGSGISFSKTQIDEVVKASMLNSQIFASFSAKPLLDKLFSAYSDMIKPELMKKWKDR